MFSPVLPWSAQRKTSTWQPKVAILSRDNQTQAWRRWFIPFLNSSWNRLNVVQGNVGTIPMGKSQSPNLLSALIPKLHSLLLFSTNWAPLKGDTKHLHLFRTKYRSCKPFISNYTIILSCGTCWKKTIRQRIGWFKVFYFFLLKKVNNLISFLSGIKKC